MSKHIHPPCTSNHRTHLGNHHTHRKNLPKNNHKPSNHLTNQTKPITHLQSKQITTQTHKNQPSDTQTCQYQFRHPLPPNRDQNLVPPPPIDVDQCIWGRERESQVRIESDSAGRGKRGENKKQIYQQQRAICLNLGIVQVSQVGSIEEIEQSSDFEIPLVLGLLQCQKHVIHGNRSTFLLLALAVGLGLGFRLGRRQFWFWF